MAAGIIFLIYNISLFSLAGFKGHAPAFWLSYGFVWVACVAVAVVMLFVSSESMRLRDWLFMWPLSKHSTLYIAAEFLASVLVMIFSNKIGAGVAVVIQLLLLGVYAVFASSCLIASETVKEMRQDTQDNTAWMRMMRVESDLAAKEATGNTDIYETLAEQFRYSDPVSNPGLEELEAEIYACVGDMRRSLRAGDYAAAEDLCEKAGMLLEERNAKCKALK